MEEEEKGSRMGGGLCDRIYALGARPAIALQLCALAAVGWLVSRASLRLARAQLFRWEAQYN